MNVKDAVRQRRSMNFFDRDFQMPEHDVAALMEHAILAPTAFNIQNWRFVRVSDPNVRLQIRHAAWDQAQVTDASLLLVLCMDLMAWDKQPERYWRNAPENVARNMVSSIHDLYANDPALQRDEGTRSCSLAAMAIMLMAQEMGYYSCALDGFDFKRVAHLIHLPDDHAICMMLAIGKPLQDPFPRSGQLELADVYFENRFPDQ